MRLFLLIFCLFTPLLYGDKTYDDLVTDFSEYERIGNKIVLDKRPYWFPNFPWSYNPSLIDAGDEFWLIFRYHPDLASQPWLSDIVIVRLNEKLDPISEPQVLNTRKRYSKTPSQSEDARLFRYRGRTFLIFNDCMDELWFSGYCRRDMFIGEIFYENGKFSLSDPLKLIYEEEYYKHICQKNWIPFEWDQTLLLSYTLNPHLVLYPNLKSGHCYKCHETAGAIEWEFGSLRGGAPPQLIDGEYLGFFHSPKFLCSESSFGHEFWHYFAGVYTFSKEPPFEIKKMAPSPFMADGFYTQSHHPKRVIFPGGFAVAGEKIYLAYGKDDCEIWIATLDKKELMNSLQPVETRREYR